MSPPGLPVPLPWRLQCTPLRIAFASRTIRAEMANPRLSRSHGALD